MTVPQRTAWEIASEADLLEAVVALVVLFRDRWPRRKSLDAWCTARPHSRAAKAIALADADAEAAVRVIAYVDALEAFCRTGSLRQAAAALYLHHSSVAARLAHVEDALGWRLDEPGDRFRAQLALWARKLAGPLKPVS